jgi:hypothetical protein
LRFVGASSLYQTFTIVCNTKINIFLGLLFVSAAPSYLYQTSQASEVEK